MSRCHAISRLLFITGIPHTYFYNIINRQFGSITRNPSVGHANLKMTYPERYNSIAYIKWICQLLQNLLELYALGNLYIRNIYIYIYSYFSKKNTQLSRLEYHSQLVIIPFTTDICTDSSLLNVAYGSLNWVIIGLDNGSSALNHHLKRWGFFYLSHPKEHISIKK